MSDELFDGELTSVGRVARWSGLVGFVLPAVTLLVYPIWFYPPSTASGSDVATWAATHQTRLMATQLLNTVGVTVWLVFAAAVGCYLRDRLPSRSVLPVCFAGSLIGCVFLLLSGFTAFDLLLYRNHEAGSATLLYDLTFGLLAMSGMPAVVALGAFAIAVYRYGVLPRYCGHLAAVSAVAHPLLLATFVVKAGPFSLQGLAIWVMPAFLFSWILGTALAMPRSITLR